MAFADQTRAKEKGQMGFLQKYYHRGVFHAVRPLLVTLQRRLPADK
jgi:microfibrillar-associated protein 1